MRSFWNATVSPIQTSDQVSAAQLQLHRRLLEVHALLGCLLALPFVGALLALCSCCDPQGLFSDQTTALPGTMQLLDGPEHASDHGSPQQRVHDLPAQRVDWEGSDDGHQDQRSPGRGVDQASQGAELFFHDSSLTDE